MIREHIQYLSALAMFLMLAGCEKKPVPEEPEKVGQQQAEQSADDREAMLGSWRVVEATANGEPYAEGIGEIYTFEAGNKVQIVGHDYEA